MPAAGVVMIIAVVHDYQARLRSYRLIAEALGISPRVVKDAKEVAR